MPKPIISSDEEFEFLSNFYPAPIVWCNKTYATSEHLFQALKTFDSHEAERIRLAPTPGKAKRLGKKASLREDWEDVKVHIMEAVLLEKFKQNPHLLVWLTATYPCELIEGNNWHDNEWGACFCYTCADIEKKNVLGNLLMKIRTDSTEITSSSFEQWAKDFKRNHPIQHWIDSLHPDGIFGYALSFALLKPWKIVAEAGRRIKWAWQRVFRGWDDRVIWSIDYYLAEMIPFWILELKKNKRGVPTIMFSKDDYTGENYEVSDEVIEKRSGEYNEILDNIIAGFVCYKKMHDMEYKHKSAEWIACDEIFDRGLDLFKEYFGTLWD